MGIHRSTGGTLEYRWIHRSTRGYTGVQGGIGVQGGTLEYRGIYKSTRGDRVQGE